MTLVVADTGPVNYLVLIGAIELLPAMVDRTVLPASVRGELLHERAPEMVRAWAVTLPPWVEVRAATRLIDGEDIALADREAIALAQELSATVLLMDDQQARQRAFRLGVPTIGTLGFLEAAAARDLVALPDVLEKLRRTSCFLSDELIERALQREAERQRATGHRTSER